MALKPATIEFKWDPRNRSSMLKLTRIKTMLRTRKRNTFKALAYPVHFSHLFNWGRGARPHTCVRKRDKLWVQSSVEAMKYYDHTVLLKILAPFYRLVHCYWPLYVCALGNPSCFLCDLFRVSYMLCVLEIQTRSTLASDTTYFWYNLINSIHI